MRLTLRDMMERDEFVLEQFVPRGIPVAVLYGGGYNREMGHTARLHRNSVAAAVSALNGGNGRSNLPA